MPDAAIDPDLTGLRMSLDGQVAVVTGGSQGIGQAIAETLASAGADIVLNHFGAAAEKVQQVSRRIQEIGRDVVAIEADVASRAEVAAMVERAFDEFGRIDILVNNAGISPECPLHEMTDDIWDRVLAVNLKGQFLVCQAVVPLMRSAVRVEEMRDTSAQLSGPGLLDHVKYMRKDLRSGESGQVTRTRCPACKTVGSAYVGSNPTPATAVPAGQARCHGYFRTTCGRGLVNRPTAARLSDG